MWKVFYQWRRQVSEFGGGHLRGNTHFGGGGKIEFHEISPPLVAKIFDPLDFFPYIFSEIFSRTDVSTTFGHFSQKSPLRRCGSYTHGSQRLMVSTEIIKNWGGKMGGGRK